jgi:hypothetical protein
MPTRVNTVTARKPTALPLQGLAIWPSASIRRTPTAIRSALNRRSRRTPSSPATAKASGGSEPRKPTTAEARPICASIRSDDD